MTKKVGVFIARMQPLHKGHVHILKLMFDECDHVIVGIGSANKARSTVNPFLCDERMHILRYTFADNADQLSIVPLNDYTYNDQTWLEMAAAGIEDAIPYTEDDDFEVVLYGYDQGSSTRYLHEFPQWGKNLVGKTEPFHATDIRKSIFFDEDTKWESMVPPQVKELLQSFFFSSYGEAETETLFEEAKKLKLIWADKAKYTYPIIDTTVDAVVICNGHVLMVTRGIHPGKGQLALPGGYLNEFENIQDGIVRELVEETAIQLKPSLLRNLLNDKGIKTYSAPGRSARGRIITHVGVIHYTSNVLPKVKGGDDASCAQWVPLYRLDEISNTIFEDHYCIIRNILGYC